MCRSCRRARKRVGYEDPDHPARVTPELYASITRRT